MNKINIQINIPVENDEKGIWQYSHYLPLVEQEFRLSLGEGNTPEENFDGVFFKREDKNPTGSLKDRGMAFLLSILHSRGAKKYVLSSSGNAAISASRYCQIAGLKIKIFVSKKIPDAKLSVLRELNAEIIFSEKPVSDGIKFAKKNNFINLRPSANEFGSVGFQTIAFEIASNLGQIDDIFIPVSSGTALFGIFQGFKKIGYLPKIHLCQSSAVSFLAEKYDKNFIPESDSLATALVAKVTPLKSEIISSVNQSNGTGWVLGNAEINQAWSKLSGFGVDTSAEGALAYAGVIKARKFGWQLGKTVCLLTGKRY